MNLLLPSQIIILTLSIGYFITLLLIIAYEHKQLTKRIKYSFLFAKFIQIIAWVGLAYGEGAYKGFFLGFANSLLFISYTLEVCAFLILKNMLRPFDKRFLYRFMFVCIIVFNLIIIIHDSAPLRIVVYSVANAVIYAFMYRLIFSKGATMLMKLIGFLYLLVSFASLIRAVVTAISSVPTSFYIPGTFQWAVVLAIYIFANLGTIGFILLMKEEVDRDLYYFANFDDLTDVLNRRSFNEQAEKTLHHYAKKQEPITYALFDVDYFKSINDTYGHLIGDKVLQSLTATMKQHLQPHDLFGRYGGDEFALLLVHKNEAQATALIQQIKQSIQPLIVNDTVVHYTISMGLITTIPSAHTRMEELYVSCDKALYTAKRNGRNIFVTGTLETTAEKMSVNS